MEPQEVVVGTAAFICRALSKPLMAADGLRELPLELVVGFTTDFEASVLEDKIHGLGGLVSSRISVRYGNTPEETCHIIRDAARNVLLSDEPHLSQFHLAGWGIYRLGGAGR